MGGSQAVTAHVIQEHRQVGQGQSVAWVESESGTGLGHDGGVGAFDLDEPAEDRDVIQFDPAGVEYPALAAFLVEEYLDIAEGFEDSREFRGVADGGFQFGS